MKRMIWLLGVMGLVMVTAVAWAQEGRPTVNERTPIGADGSAVPFTINAGGATCGEASLLSLPGGDSTDVSSAGFSADDPTLTCAWGNPERPQGYRTVWYRFVPPKNGIVTISTRNSGYDTILAVHVGSCEALPGSLSTVACNDDANGFTSEVTLNVYKGTTYYVEVADWHQAVDDPTLQLSVILEPIESQWELLGAMAVPLSRHTAVAVAASIYVVGGQDNNVFTGTPSNRLLRYSTVDNTWTELQPMPGETGYAHPAAVFYEGRIYVPTGVVNSYYVGNQLNQDVDDTHWVYTGATNSWSTRPGPTSWPGDSPWTWTAAVASPDPQKQGYYLIGGLASSAPLVVGADARSEMLFYSTVTNNWFDEPEMAVGGTAVPRYGHTAVWLNNRVCVTGGLDGNAQLLSQGMCYNPGTDAWAYTGAMREPRYGASSAVGPDGRWYVFGGIGASGTTASTEVYDPQTNTWTLLAAPFDLTYQTLPLAWLQVKWTNGHFWAIGGETGLSAAPLPSVEKLYIPQKHSYLPFVRKPGSSSSDSYDNFAEARRLQLNVSQEHNFNGLLDFVDVFYVDIPSLRPVRFRLVQIPDDSNFDIAVYNSNKLLWGKGQNLNGQDEDLTRNLPAGRYYIMVTREFPLGFPDPDVYYKVKVEG
ncbi:MAG: hypothetical protein H6658_04670 [Ardenticatenaceae bacterium]|nr:hypothetical protein [Ardenticatenaceae bacterium]